jgi:hypothetical protein
VILITRLKNQRALTQTAYLGGENTGGLAGVERTIGWEVVALARR